MEKRKDERTRESRKKSKDEAGLTVTFDEHVKEIDAETEKLVGDPVDQNSGSEMRSEDKKIVEKKYYSSPEVDGEVKTACFGVKSYLHQFYDSKVETQVEMCDDVVEEDDFAYLVDLEKQHRKRGYRLCLGLWVGANLLLIGMIAVLIGMMTPRREEVVAYHDDLKMLDRWAIKFNERLDFCLKLGLFIFGIGNCTMFLSFICMVVQGHNVCLMGEIEHQPATPSLQRLDASQDKYRPQHGPGGKIPVTEEITSVQPKGDNLVLAAEKRFGSRAMQTPYY